jgi:tetratricopeptide (TPR) repeat protein
MKRMWLLQAILIALSLDRMPVIAGEMLPVVAQVNEATTGAELLKLAEEELKNNRRETAIKLLDRALGIFEAKLDFQGKAKALGNLGNVYRQLGQYQKAENYHQQSLQIAQKIKDRQSESNALGNLGIIYSIIGEHQKAESYLGREFQILREIKNPHSKLNLPGNFGNRNRTGSHQRYSTLHSMMQVLREFRDQQREFNVLDNIGTVYYHLKEFPTAIKYLQQATEVSDSLRTDLTDENKVSLFETQLQTYKRLATALYLTGDQSASLIATERGRTRVFNDLIAKRLADTPNLFPAIAFTFEQLQAQAIFRKSTIISYNILDPFNILIYVLKPDGILTVRESSISQTPKLTTHVLTPHVFNPYIISKPYVLEPDEDLTPREIPIPQTPELNNLITNSRTAIKQSGEYALRQQAGSNTTLSQRGNQLDLNTLKPGMKVRLKSDSATAPGRAVIAINIATGIMTLETQGDGKPTREEVSFSLVREILPTTFTAETRSLQQLHQILIEPIADLLPSNPQSPVIFIPDGVLYEVPFAALQDPQGRYLIEKHTISLAPSLSVLVQTGQLQQRRLSPVNQSLVVGNPTLSKEHESLPYSQLEAQQVAKQLQSPVLLGSAATKAQVTRQLSTAPIIHLATHGGYNSQEGLNSSGIFLTGSGNKDGFLTASEVLNYKLQADLVVVSSCDSGRGQISGDGVLGLSRSQEHLVRWCRCGRSMTELRQI